MSYSSANSILGSVMNSDIMKGIQQQKIRDKRMSIELKIKSKIPYPLKRYYNPVIPLNIYQTWHTKNLPPLMKNSVNKIINSNPRFNYKLFDDDDCRNFIKDNFDENVLNAFDSLIPGAYKADLWRYCILYKNGGVYLDIKYVPFNGFRFINLMEKEHWVLDMDKNGIYNALMVCKPNNEILLRAINKVVDNVKNKFYGSNCLHPTGPIMLAEFFTQSDKNNFDMYHDIYQSVENRFVFFNGYIIFKSYNYYLDEHNKNKKVDYYGSLWAIRNIYK
jgi:mannosyltransferase OCH1-like enzyme